MTKHHNREEKTPCIRNNLVKKSLEYVVSIPSPKVRKERDGKIVDARCHALIAPHVRERYASDPTDVSVSVCNLYEEFDRNGREGRDSGSSRPIRN